MTGRLIDANATIPMIKYATTDNEIGVFPIKIGFDDIVKVLNAQPTVDAIPVEWLEEYATNLANKEKANSYAFRGYKDGALWIRSMIRAWREE